MVCGSEDEGAEGEGGGGQEDGDKDEIGRRRERLHWFYREFRMSVEND